MSLIIKGMEMPEYRDVFGDERGCVYLLMLTVNKDGTASMQFTGVDGGFHRVKEAPTPHGRLIDADKLMQWIEHAYGDKDIIKLITDDIKRQPTIVEAEELNENS